MSSCKNLVGLRFGSLVVKEKVASSKHKHARWLCLCDCGNTSIALTGHLKRGSHKTCGCGRFRTHGMSNTSIYHVWQKMHDRCKNEKEKYFYNYGGRGIKVCEDWSSFENFYRDMGATYEYGLQLDREDNNSGYSKKNCRWVTRLVNNRNKRTNVLVEYKGREVTLIEASELSGINKWTIVSRAQAGLRESTGLFYLGRLRRNTYKKSIATLTHKSECKEKS